MTDGFNGTKNDLVITNTWFQEHPRRLWTWKSPDDNTKTKLITLSYVKDSEKQSINLKHTLEQTVSATMSQSSVNFSLN